MSTATIVSDRARCIAFQTGYSTAKRDDECTAVNPYNEGDKHGKHDEWIRGYAVCKEALAYQNEVTRSKQA